MIEHLTQPSPAELDALTALWEASVRATHDFLSEEDIPFFRQMVRNEALPAVDLYVTRDTGDRTDGTDGPGGTDGNRGSTATGPTGETGRDSRANEFGGFTAFAGVAGKAEFPRQRLHAVILRHHRHARKHVRRDGLQRAADQGLALKQRGELVALKPAGAARREDQAAEFLVFHPSAPPFHH